VLFRSKKFPELAERPCTLQDIYDISCAKFKEHIVYARIVDEIDKLADTNKSNSSNDIGIMLNTSLKSTQPYVIKSKDFIDDIPFTSWNYGAHAGKSNATTGLSISYSKGDDIIKIAISPVSGQSADGYNSIIKSAKESGFKQVTKGDFEAPTSQSRKVVDFVKTSLPQLK
jgi:hypothetical protein